VVIPIAKSWATLLLCLSLSPALRGATPVEDLLQQAFLKEARERNLEAAIDLYREVANVPGADPMLRFEARLRMGSCYEVLGKYEEASEIYEQILKNTSAPQSELSHEVEANWLRLKGRITPRKADAPGAETPHPRRLGVCPSNSVRPDQGYFGRVRGARSDAYLKGTLATSNDGIGQKSPGPQGKPIFGWLRRHSSSKYAEGIPSSSFLASSSNLGFSGSRYYSDTLLGSFDLGLLNPIFRLSTHRIAGEELVYSFGGQA
jgi:tetratricopeptide (TPR) repeat protein